jgi:hypothetical protein
MATNFESRLKKALEDPDRLKKTECFDDATLGRYIEGGLSESERARIEKHTGSCFHCLALLVELKELLSFQKKENPLLPDILEKIEALGLPRKKEIKKSSFNLNGLFAGMAQFLLLPFRQWRYAAVGIMSACMAVMIALTIPSPEKGGQKLPNLNLDAFAQVKALDAGGKVLKESQGLIIGGDGIIASDLSAMVGASSIKITLRDGKSFNIKHLWKDDGRNLALLKVEGEALPHHPIADLEQMRIGQKVFVVADPSRAKNILGEAVISDLMPYSGRREKGNMRFIQLATFIAQYTRGAIVDSEGRLVGVVVTGEKYLNLAVPLDKAMMLVKSQNPLPVNTLKDIKVPTDALNFYFKGIIARDAKKQDEAIEYFKKAVELNPNLEAAHLELGFLYYRKRLFDFEKKTYEAALKINPDNTDTLFYLATNLETMGLYDEAIKIFEKIVALDGEDTDSYYELGLAYLARGQKAKALDAYSKLQKLDPGLAGKLRRLIK